LLVGDWDNQLSLHKARECQLVSNIPIQAQPTVLLNFQSNLLMADISGKVTLHKDDGQVFGEIADVYEWIWPASVSSDGYFSLGINDGTVAVYSWRSETVYSVYHTSFAIRTEPTKVRLRVLETDLIEDIEFFTSIQDLP
jgi:hypothetical protein